ncbi:MAG: iron-containing alcohol dehydrogenase [Clostridia bacterium]|nr:iron-containing alcohol dehydrogenase [Clostridia bacterium]
MEAFTYSYPVKVYFGEKEAEKNLPAELAKIGENVLLAYGGGSIKKNGVYDELMSTLKAAGKSEEELANAFVDALAAFIKEIGLPTTFAEMNISEDTDFKAIADTTILTGGCAKKFTADELYEVLLECR